MAGKRCSPWGPSSVIYPQILLCRPWTLASQNTPSNHILPCTSQNKDCRGIYSWHGERTLHSQTFYTNRECQTEMWNRLNLWIDQRERYFVNAHTNEWLQWNYSNLKDVFVYPAEDCLASKYNLWQIAKWLYECFYPASSDSYHWDICCKSATDRLMYEEKDRQLLKRWSTHMHSSPSFWFSNTGRYIFFKLHLDTKQIESYAAQWGDHNLFACMTTIFGFSPG